jgi:hypothetical protein
MARGLQVTGTDPFADADTGLQAIFARRSEVNATINAADPAARGVGKLRDTPDRKSESEPVVKGRLFVP